MAEQPSRRPLSALPSVRARALAFTAILLAGLAGGLIGYGFGDLQCSPPSCTTSSSYHAIGALVGAVIAAGGTAVVAVLALRAMGEWRALADRDGT